jgi:alkylhydroperoxidase family enzyme
MTWLPIEVGELPERDAVLGLVPEPYAAFRDVLTVAWRIADPQVLELCRLRLAQLAGARAELADVDEELLTELEGWESSSVFGENERAALAFAEQYHYDHQRLSDDQRAELARHLTPRETVNFVWALHMNLAYIRVLSLLDIAPDPPGTPIRRERVALDGGAWQAGSSGVEDDRETDVRALMDPEFAVAYRRLSPVIVKQPLVDEVTSEAVRLHNASYQGCLH